MDAILARLDSIEAKLDRALFPPIITFAELRKLTGCKSDTAQHRWNHRHGLKSYERGKYRRLEAENKIAHARLFGKSAKPIPAKTALPV